MVTFRSFGLHRLSWLMLFFMACLLTGQVVHAFDNTRNDNLAVYWGQDSAGNQQRLSYYCSDDTIDAIPLAFLYIFFGKGGDPVIDFANSCNQWDNGTFSGTDLAECQGMASDIKTCQSKGKIVTLSIGGATGQVGFSNDTQAKNFATQIWNMFLGGSSSTRPFGSAVLDGVDLDIESGSPSHYAAFVNQIRSLSEGASKKYYITAAPQCPFPDASIGAALNAASFDAVYVQFYNNYCGLDQPDSFNFDTWDNWAKNTSPNKNVKVYIGAAGSSNAAGEGYVGISTMNNYITETQKQYSSFGGVMLWDASEAHTNNRYDAAVKQTLTKGSSSKASTTSASEAKPTPVPKATPSSAAKPPVNTAGSGSPNHHLTIPKNTTKDFQPILPREEATPKRSRLFRL